MNTFKVIRIDNADGGTQTSYANITADDLMDGDVTVRVTHSSINYKDGLAMTGKSPVVRRFPMVPGIDFAGVVEQSQNSAFSRGDSVVLTGWGVGEVHLGGLAEFARVPGEWLVPLPKGLTAEEAMAVGTAGFTAMLSVAALERVGLSPDGGPVIVTGASGGVGSIAVALLSNLRWHVIASTGRPEEADFLTRLGASEICPRDMLSAPGKPLGKERWFAGVDSVGSHTLANVLAQTKSDGAVAACGLAQGMDLPMTVAPFILRGVSLLGINSVYCPQQRRIKLWERISKDLDRDKLASITNVIEFDDALDAAPKILEGKIRGRTVVRIG